MHIFVTVGSTKFDLLIEEICSPECLEALSVRGCDKLVIQYGNSHWPSEELSTAKLHVEGFSFKQSTAEDIHAADLIISHAGKLNTARLEDFDEAEIRKCDSRLGDDP